MKDESLHDAFGKWEELSATQEERLAYEVRLKQVLDADAAVREAELRVQEAMEKGMENGRKKEREVIARRLLALGMNKEEVAKLAGLTMRQLDELS